MGVDVDVRNHVCHDMDDDGVLVYTNTDIMISRRVMRPIRIHYYVRNSMVG